MNREAAALGVPVYSIFRGQIGAVDRYLAETGRLTLVGSVQDVRSKIRPVKRLRPKGPDVRESVALTQIMTVIDQWLERPDIS
jgi:predicted glycosyltransferase